MESSIEILEEAESHALMTLEEAKVLLNVNSTGYDAMIQMLIDINSSVIETLIGRTLARERVIDTIYGVDSSRIYLSHFPVKAEDIESVYSGGYLVTDYLLEEATGKISTPGAAWLDPVEVKYTGGFDLPTGAPDALKRVSMLMLQDKFTATGTVRESGVRMISHKEARVMYYDQSGGGKSGSSTGGTVGANQRAIDALLMRFTRLWV